MFMNPPPYNCTPPTLRYHWFNSECVSRLHHTNSLVLCKETKTKRIRRGGDKRDKEKVGKRKGKQQKIYRYLEDK